MLYLASQSPRRRELLTQLGVEFSLLDVAVPEVRSPRESPREYVARVARAKAEAGMQRAARGDPAPVVLGADTEVVLDGRVFGKPADAAAAAVMLAELAGRQHRVISAVCCLRVGGIETAVCESEVSFAPIDAVAIARYVASGEPFGKAGGYAIQGRAAAFISHLSGSYSAVVGLPLHETARLLRGAGLASG